MSLFINNNSHRLNFVTGNALYFKANGFMSGQIKRGTAKRGYYYTQVGEDAGSISAVVPNAAHIERIAEHANAPESQAGGAAKEPGAVESPSPAEPPKVELTRPRSVDKIERKLRLAGVEADTHEELEAKFVDHYKKNALHDNNETVDQFYDWIRCGGKL